MKKKNTKENEAWLVNLENIVLEKASENNLPETIIQEDVSVTPAEYVLGIKVRDEQRTSIQRTIVNTEKAVRLQKSDAFFSKRETFKTGLNALEVEPIAIIPTKVWEEISKKCGLYRFENFKRDHSVPAKTINLLPWMNSAVFFLACIPFAYQILNTYLNGAASPRQIIMLLIFYPASLYLMMMGDYIDRKTSSNGNLIIKLFIITTLISICAPLFILPHAKMFVITSSSTFVFFTFVLTNKMVQRFFFRISVSIMPMKKIIKLIWPKGIDEKIAVENEENHLELSQSVKPYFPEPNQEFKDILIKLRRNASRLCLAAERKAIRISRRELWGKTARIISYNERCDPILYIKSDDQENVAILGQFGRFSKEKKAIALVKSIKIDDLL